MKRVLIISVYRLTSGRYDAPEGALGLIQQEYPELDAAFMDWFLMPDRDCANGCFSSGPIATEDLEPVAQITFPYEDYGLVWAGAGASLA